ncbi:hypothetical protein EON63_02035 [archaeon]|nr:MAG: hypothetical protein EON63_02035 [archaeon]
MILCSYLLISCTLGTVMAQTVALDYYASSVDRMLEGFIKMNQKIQQSGSVEDLRMPGMQGVWCMMYDV